MSNVQIQKLTPSQRFRLKHPNYYREYFKTNPKPKLSPEYSKNWRKNHLEQNRAKQRVYKENNPGIVKQHATEYVARNPLKYHCRQASLKYPMAEHCAVCQSANDLQRHHIDYSKPHVFTTLCRQCHQIIHTYLGVTK